MKLARRQFLNLAAGAAATPAAARLAFADTYPSRPVRIVVGFPPGAATDIVGRLIAQTLSERLHSQFFVENRPGAGSNLAADVVAHAAPDGYTLLGDDRHQCGQRDALQGQESRPRFHARPVADRPHHHLGQRAGGEFVGAGQDHAGVHCLRQSQSRQAQLRILWLRHRAQHGGRAVQHDGRHQARPRAVSLELHARHAERTGATGVSAGAADHRLHPRRQGARARRQRRKALATRCRACRRSRNSFRAIRPTSGTASRRRRARRRRSPIKLHNEINASSTIRR